MRSTPTQHAEASTVTLSIIIPCLNEARTLGGVIDVANAAIQELDVSGEVIVVDNGSSDGSQALASAHGARVIDETTRGYGSALRRGCDEARGRFLVMGDADASYDFSEIGPFLDALQAGGDLVLGSRTRGSIDPGAMPWKNRYIGNPVSTKLLNGLHGSKVSDVHCGLRALSSDAYRALDLRATGMEFASEMVIKASISGMDIREVPIRFHADGRGRPPHLRPFRDGWRHLKLILLFSPTALFLVPGIALLVLGMALMWSQLLAPFDGPLRIGSIRMDFHWAILGSLLASVGYQVVLIALFARLYAMTTGLSSETAGMAFAFRHLTLERVVGLGLLSAFVGAAMVFAVAATWLRSDLGPLVSGATREFVLGSTLIALGMQTVFAAFFFSILRDDYAHRAS
jgi:glycosyl transferase family 2